MFTNDERFNSEYTRSKLLQLQYQAVKVHNSGQSEQMACSPELAVDTRRNNEFCVEMQYLTMNLYACVYFFHNQMLRAVLLSEPKGTLIVQSRS